MKWEVYGAFSYEWIRLLKPLISLTSENKNDLLWDLLGNSFSKSWERFQYFILKQIYFCYSREVREMAINVWLFFSSGLPGRTKPEIGLVLAPSNVMQDIWWNLIFRSHRTSGALLDFCYLTFRSPDNLLLKCKYRLVSTVSIIKPCHALLCRI